MGQSYSKNWRCQLTEEIWKYIEDYELKNKFITVQIMTKAISKLLHNHIEENNRFINKVYAERNARKEGVN